MYPQQPQQGFPSPQQYQQPTTQQYAQPQQPVDREIQGTLVNVEQRNNGWFRFSIAEQGRQYPVKVDTKKPETVQQAMSMMGQPVAAQIREQQSDNINPNNGKPYVNRYLNSIAPAGFSPGVQPAPGAVGPQGQVYQPQQQQPPQQAAFAPPTQTQYPAPTHSEPVQQQFQPGLQGVERELAIMRQTAAKVVASSWTDPVTDTSSLVQMIEAAEVWVAYFMQGPLRFGVTPFNQPRQPSAEAQQMGQQFAAAYEQASQPLQGAPQIDIFGAPMQPDGTPINSDPGREQGDPGPSYA
jgi:hypothetical protein